MDCFCLFHSKNMVNIDRLRITGLPGDIVVLIELRLKNRSLYVEVYGLNTMYHDINSATIQGSILGLNSVSNLRLTPF